MALALVFSSATIWSSECRTSSRLPRASKTTQTMSTLAMLTAALRQKFCHALLKAKSMRFQSRCMVPSCIFVSDDLAAFDRHHPAPHDVDDLPVVGRHQHRGTACIDLEDHADLPPQERQVAPLEATQVLPLDVDAAGGRLLLADQEADQRRLPGAAWT